MSGERDVFAEVQKIRESMLEKHITDAFHEMYFWSSHTWNYSQTTWMGVPIFQCPLDLWVLQEILVSTKPDIVIEIGSGYGGTALFMVSCFPGKVISIDNQETMKPIPIHPRIEFVKGHSRDVVILDQVKILAAGKKVLLYQDGDHSADGVYKDLTAYEEFIPIDSYIIVHDTNLNGRPIAVREGDENYKMDPFGGILRFLREHDDFVIDRTREKYYLTFSPGGWLKRVKPEEKKSAKPVEEKGSEDPVDYTEQVKKELGIEDYKPGGDIPVAG